MQLGKSGRWLACLMVFLASFAWGGSLRVSAGGDDASEAAAMDAETPPERLHAAALIVYCARSACLSVQLSANASTVRSHAVKVSPSELRSFARCGRRRCLAAPPESIGSGGGADPSAELAAYPDRLQAPDAFLIACPEPDAEAASSFAFERSSASATNSTASLVNSGNGAAVTARHRGRPAVSGLSPNSVTTITTGIATDSFACSSEPCC